MNKSSEKVLKQKKTLSDTLSRRKNQDCKVYELKIDYSSLSPVQRNFLKMIFIEARWFYNHVLSQDNIFDSKIRKIKEVVVRVADEFETRELKYISSQMKQGLHERIVEAIKVLSKLKKKNFKIGRLKFKPELNSIELPQFKKTWNFKGKRIQVQGCKQTFKVNGIKQIPEGVEFANAFIVRKASGYYIHVTTFQPKKEIIKTGKSVGIDFGIKDMIVTSDGEKFNISIPESPKLKRLQMWFAKKIKGSKNRRKILRQIKLEYEKMGNQKKDKVDKLISYLSKTYDTIYIQDENINGWKSWFGGVVQHSALGAIKAGLKELESTQVISRFEPTTKLCYRCGKINKIGLNERVYKCECGLEEDRDVKAAKTILLMGQGKLPTKKKIKTHNSTERSFTLAEEAASAVVLDFQNHRKLSPVKQEVSAVI
jgi:putative transposase